MLLYLNYTYIHKYLTIFSFKHKNRHKVKLVAKNRNKMDQKEVKKQVIKFYNENKDKGKIFTVKHFEKKGETSSTIYRYLKDEPCTSSSSRSPFGDATNTGKVVKKTTKKNVSVKPPLLVPIQKSNFNNKCKCNFFFS